MKRNPFEHGRWAKPAITLANVGCEPSPQLRRLIRSRMALLARIAAVDRKISATIRQAQLP